MPKALDLTGKKIGKLTVLYPLKERKNGKIQWHCKCECGNEIDVISSSLSRGNTKSCGCLQRERASQANRSYEMEGKVFGRLTVLKRNQKGNKWICKCECGNEIEVDTNHLNSGHTRSCGCLLKDKNKERIIDITGQKFGLLTVIGKNPDSPLKNIHWYCKCECGNIIEVSGKNLKSGNTQSCGCLKISHGELKIKQLLDNANIPYIMEYGFSNCINPKTNKLLRFDFYVNNQYLIEYDGEQHFNKEKGWGENIEDIHFRDNYKTEWCKQNNIPLIRIPYTKLKSLKLQDIVL